MTTPNTTEEEKGMITANEYDILRHTHNTGRYVTDEDKVIAMGERGLLCDHGPQALAGGMHYFTLTSAGREAMSEYLASLPQPPKLTKRQERAKARYQRYVESADCFQDFRHFLNYDADRERKNRNIMLYGHES